MAEHKVRLSHLGFTRCETPLSTVFIFSGDFFAPNALGPSPPGRGAFGAPDRSPEARATTPLIGSMSVERCTGFCAVGKPATGGHDVPGPRRFWSFLRGIHTTSLC